MKKWDTRIISALAILSVALACLIILRRQQEERTAHTKSLFAMDTFFILTAYGPEAEDALARCAVRVEELEGLLSVTKEGGDIARINGGEKTSGDFEEADRGGSGGIRETREGIPVCEDTFMLIQAAIELGEETSGALDVTLYPVLREWGFTTGEYRIPEADKLRSLLDKTDYRQVEADGASRTIFVPAGVELDLGAVAKGYTGDCLLTILKERGVTSAMLDLGGNVQTLGVKPDGSPWRIAVKNPFDGSAQIGVLEISDKAVITSGSYERYFTGEDGKNYWHILDPADGYPADGGLTSVTVVGDSGVRCDGLSTALFVMGGDGAADFWRRRGDFEMILVTTEGELYLTEGLEENFTCGEGWNAKILHKDEREQDGK